MTDNDYINVPEYGREIIHMIYDKWGNAYTVSGHLSSSSFISNVCSETDCVGRINWLIKDGVLEIADLVIFELFDIKRWWVRVFPFLYNPPINYKGRGLGSAMLNFIIESAQAMGMSEIRGRITGDDLKETPHLVEFYRKHGFIVNDSSLAFYQVLD